MKYKVLASHPGLNVSLLEIQPTWSKMINMFLQIIFSYFIAFTTMGCHGTLFDSRYFGEFYYPRFSMFTQGSIMLVFMYNLFNIAV